MRVAALGVLAMLVAGASRAEEFDFNPECVAVAAPENWRWHADTTSDEAAVADRASLRLRSEADIRRLRRDLYRFFWRRDTLPATRPATRQVVEQATVLPTGIPPQVEKVEHLLVDMGAVRSNVYVFWPKNAHRELVIYHGGHEFGASVTRFYADRPIQWLIRSGFVVAALSMPIAGVNFDEKVMVDLPGVGPKRAQYHEHFRWLPRDDRAGHPLRYFVEPVIATLNELLRGNDFDSVSMTGISGGGWTTTVAAALDPRIRRSFPVAGSLPVHRRWYDTGDFESPNADLLRVATDLELYLLGSAGKGRRQVQMLIKYDTCCFAAERVPSYVTLLQERLQATGGGSFDFFLDETLAGHGVSRCASARMVAEILGKPAPPITPAQ